jgi:chitodextrinase
LVAVCSAITAVAQQSVYWQKDYIRDGDGVVAEVTPPPTDPTAPTAPTNLAFGNLTSSTVELSWSPSTDSGGSGLAGYKIYRGSVPVGSASSMASGWTDNTLKPQTNYNYRVIAVDGARNHSSPSNSVNFTTPAP